MTTPLLTILVWLALVVAAPARADDSAAPVWRALRTPGLDRVSLAPRYIRTRGDRFELVSLDGGAHVIRFRGINMGAAPPGRFPGEFAITKEDYRRWIRFARDLHANAIRVYALHPPAFYEVLDEENAVHPERPLWLFQEVWTELPPANDFWDAAFTRGFEDEIRLAVDALHGNALVRERPGHASGRYDVDASRWLAGWLLGREWEPYAVRETQARHPDSTRFRGDLFAVEEGTAMETWLARICDHAASYERRRYGRAHAVSFVNWPTLDPMRHPTETERGGREAEHDEDAFSVDPSRIRLLQPDGTGPGVLGYFANYHVYPYYPDFMNLDPGYAAHKDRHGPCAYAGYLADLKAHTPGLPLLIGEYGVPTSRGIAHVQPQGINHGGASEEEQGARDVRLLEDIEDSGAAGSLLFSLFDEWFKVNWMVERVERPRDRDPLWLNRLDPEESYGLIAFDPPAPIRIDGRTEDWRGIRPYAESAEPVPSKAPVRALYVTSDQTRIFLRLDLARGAPLSAVGISFDVLDSARGDTRLPAPLRATWSRGAEFLLLIEPRTRRAELFVDRSMNYSSFARVRSGETGFDRHRAPFRPVANQDGLYIPLLVETNRERVSRSGAVYPAKILDEGRLSYGVEGASGVAWPGEDSTASYDPHADWAMDRREGTVEIALPWQLLNVGDPSSHSVLDDDPETPEVEVTRTDGIGLLAWGTTAPGLEADSLGPTNPRRHAAKPPGAFFFLGPEGTSQVKQAGELRLSAPRSSSYLWNGWDRPITRERIKRSAIYARDAFEGMEAREESPSRKAEAERH